MIAEKEDLEDPQLRIDCPVLVTERLVLRPPHEDDVHDMAILANDRAVADMLERMPHPYGEADARAFLERTRTDKGDGCAYAVTLARNGAFIGAAGLHPSPRGLELGYWLGRPFWGHGYATEAAHSLVDLAFRATPVEELHVSCRVGNAASLRVIRKCGFHYVANGMMDSRAAGPVSMERHVLERSTWLSLRSWGQR